MAQETAMSKTIEQQPARLKADDANNLELLADVMDLQDKMNGGQNEQPQSDLRRIAQYLREAFPTTINQPKTQ